MEIGKVIQQGEVRFKKIASLPDGEDLKPMKKESKLGFILAHSESGNHHILTGGEVLERPAKFTGLQRMYAVIKNPEKLIQDATSPHETQLLEPGIYDIRISREFNPFLQMAKKVTD